MLNDPGNVVGFDLYCQISHDRDDLFSLGHDHFFASKDSSSQHCDDEEMYSIGLERELANNKKNTTARTIPLMNGKVASSVNQESIGVFAVESCVKGEVS